MRIYDRYVLRQTLKPLAIALLVALLVLLIERMLRLLDLVLGARGPLKMVFEIMAYLVPHYIGLALPISLLIGIMVAFNRLSRDGEIDALHCAGVSLGRMSRATFFAAAVVAVISGIVIGYLKPFGRYAYQAMVFAVSHAALNTLVKARVFTAVGDTTVLVNEINANTGTFSNVFLYQRDDDGGSTVVTARNGDFVRVAQDGMPILRLFDGVRLTLRQNGTAVRPERQEDNPAGVLRFRQLRMVLGDQTPMFRLRGADEREFTLGELWERRNAPPAGVRPTDLVAELHGRIVRILSVPFLPLLGIPLALGRRRSDRTYGIALGLLVLILYNQIVDLGENMAETGDLHPIVGLWLPFVVFAGFTLYLFRRASARLPASSSFPVPSAVRRSLERRFGWIAGEQ